MDISVLNVETFNTDGHIFDPDSLFGNFKLLEMPMSYVGLATSIELDVGENFDTDVYLKTFCGGQLMKYNDARQISAAHRAFYVEQMGNYKLKITFYPTNECIFKAKLEPDFDMRFIIDLRIFRISGKLCCLNEDHAEIKRFYISGQCVYFEMTCYPEIVDYGDIIMNTKVTKHVRLHNSAKLRAKCQYVKIINFDVLPAIFTIDANSVKHITITLCPTSFLTSNVLDIVVINPHGDFSDIETDGNFLSYRLKVNARVIYPKKPRDLNIESLHKLYEKNPEFTYLEHEYEERDKKKAIGLKTLQDSKASHVKPKKETQVTYKGPAYVNDVPEIGKKTGRLFCKIFPPKPTNFDLIDIFIEPFYINFGRIETSSIAESSLTIVNRTQFSFSINFIEDQIITFTNLRLPSFKVKVNPYSESKMSISCTTVMDGLLCETFSYVINNKYNRCHRYTLQAGNPKFNLPDNTLKFGLITSDTFVTTVAIKLCNLFNVPVKYIWQEINAETPFEVYPKSGTIPPHTCRINEIVYICKPTKTKSHELEILSIGNKNVIIPVEANVLFRKLSVRFLDSVLNFKDVPLNLETSQITKLENGSRDYASFHVLEPLMPGMTIKPMSGILRPKMILEMKIILQLGCVIDFTSDIIVKINNKEVIELVVNGNVEAPTVYINPKLVQLNRVSCNMVTFVSLNIVNPSVVKAVIEVLDTGDENMFDVVMIQGNEKVKFSKLVLEPGQSKNIFVKVYDVYRREYDMYLPIKVNGFLGPPTVNTNSSTELRYYTQEYENLYDANAKVKLRAPENREICYCRLSGVITVQWIEFSVDNFEIEYSPLRDNSITFTMRNISRYNFYVSILLGKLFPNFTLEFVESQDVEVVLTTDTYIKFDLLRGVEVTLKVTFHPRNRGKLISTAIMYLDKAMTIPYSDLTFTGLKQVPNLTTKTELIIFPPCEPGTEQKRKIELEMEGIGYDIDDFQCSYKDEKHLKVELLDMYAISETTPPSTVIEAMITVCAPVSFCGKVTLIFTYGDGSCCNVYVNFTYTLCPLTLHRRNYVDPENDPYPFYPLPEQTEYYDYMNSCVEFLEQWLFQQGFRRELFPIIPDTLLTVAGHLGNQTVRIQKVKCLNVSFLNFMKRIAGNLVKNMKKLTSSFTDLDESLKSIKEILHMYGEIIKILQARGSNLWGIKPKYLLSYDQFIIYSDVIASRTNVDIIMTQKLLADEELFNRLSKQSWLDVILQCYRAFVIDSCAFDCICVSGENRDIVGALINWYNDSLIIHHNRIFKQNQQVKSISNLTTDLSDGLAIISVFLYHCPFMDSHFSLICIENIDTEETQINNAALIVEALNLLRIYFPLQCKDFLQPNFLKMLFLSIHLYITLPMFTIRETIIFNPPLLRSSSRQIIVSTGNQETLVFNIVLINNNHNSFFVEKTTAPENVKKLYLLAKFTANFLKEEKVILLLHGYNKSRLFDTYIIFILEGVAGMVNPLKKCKITAPLYRPMKLDIPISIPFTHTNPIDYKLHLTDIEPMWPVEFEQHLANRFYVQRIYLMEDHVVLTHNRDSPQKLNTVLVCLSAQQGASWIWFTSEVGEFYIRVTTVSRCDMALEILQTKALTIPLVPCSCGEDCECYRTSTVTIMHKNELMVRALRFSLSQLASNSMMNIFDQLIESTYGRLVLHRLFTENGTNMTEISHILKDEIVYHITSRNLCPQKQTVTFQHHTDDTFILPVTLPNKKVEKFSVVFTSECGMDIRIYKVFVLAEGSESG